MALLTRPNPAYCQMQLTPIALPTVPHPGNDRGPDNHHSASFQVILCNPLEPWSLSRSGHPSSPSTPFNSLCLYCPGYHHHAPDLLKWPPNWFPFIASCPLLCPCASCPAHCSQSELSTCESHHAPLLYSRSSEDKGTSPCELAPACSPASSHPLSCSLRKNQPSFSSLDVPCPFLSQHFYPQF